MAEGDGAIFTSTDALTVLANFVAKTREARNQGLGVTLVVPTKDPQEIAMIVRAATYVIATMADVYGMSDSAVRAMFAAAIYVERNRT